MKRFCIFLITGTVVIFLFLILAILFKGIGLYIAMAVIATIFLILSSIILYGVLKLRKCNFYLQNYDVEPIIKSYKFLSKILFLLRLKNFVIQLLWENLLPSVLQLVVQLFLQQITKHANMASVLVCLFKPQENYVQI